MNTERGFSLIEILVGVGVMGILAATGVASYNKVNDRAKVEQAAQLLATELRTWQKRADAGVNSCGSGQKFGGVSVQYDDQQLSYCDLCNDTCTNEPVVYGPINGVELSLDSSFKLLSLGKGVNNPSTITVSKNQIIYTINITPAGGISVAKAE